MKKEHAKHYHVHKIPVSGSIVVSTSFGLIQNLTHVCDGGKRAGVFFIAREGALSNSPPSM